MTVDASLVADLRNSWKARDGAGIQRALARILGERAAVDEIQHGLTALAGELGFSIKLSAAGKRKREAALEAALRSEVGPLTLTSRPRRRHRLVA